MTDDISLLLKEAKPLYFARKRRNNVIKSVAAMLVCVVMVGWLSPKNYTYEYQDVWSSEIYLTENGSVIEDMGLPVDEYGLLAVV